MNEQQVQHERFNEYFEAYSDAIFRHISFKISDRARAKELTQEVFMRLWKTLQKGEHIEYPKKFLYTIAHNLFVNEWRDRKESVSIEDLQKEGLEPGTDGEQELLKREAQEIIEIFQHLPPQYREVLTLRYVDEYEVKEIADLLHETANVVSVRIHRALHRLRKIIEQRGHHGKP